MRLIRDWHKTRDVFCILLLIVPALCAAQVPPAAIPIDAEIEQAIDDTLRRGDAEGGGAYTRRLLEIEASVPIDLAVGTRVRLDNYLVYHYQEEGELERAGAINARILELAETHGYADFWALGLVGELLLLTEDAADERRIAIAEQILSHAPQVRADRVQYIAYFTAAGVYWNANIFEAALLHFQSALDVVNRTDAWRNDFRRLMLKWNITSLHAELKNWTLALDLADQTLSAALAQSYHRFLPDLFLIKGQALYELERLEPARQALLEGLDWSTRLGLTSSLAELHAALGEISLREGQADEAADHLQIALEAARQAKLPTDEIEFNLGYVHLVQGQRQSGLASMQRALLKIEKSADVRLERALGRMAEAYGQVGNHNQEVASLRRQIALSRSLFQEKRDAKVSELEMQFAAKESVRKVAMLEQANKLNASLINRQELQQRVSLLVLLASSLALILLWLLYRKIRRINARLKSSNAKLEYQSTHDELTGLLNRRYFQDQIEQEHRLKPPGSEPDARHDGIILIDVDHFKHVNDSLGHAAGDAVLVDIGKRLIKASRDNDLVVRWGGEEFLLYVRGIPFAALTALCERILVSVAEQPFDFAGHSLDVTISAGFLSIPFPCADGPIDDVDALLSLADKALYQSKLTGRNRACGLRSLNGDFKAVQDSLESGMAEAISKQLVAAVSVLGPSPATAIVAPVELTNAAQPNPEC